MTPKKYPQKSPAQKIVIFSEIPKNIEIQNLKPPKIGQAYVYIKNQSTPRGSGQTNAN